MSTTAVARDWFRIFGENRNKTSLLDKIRQYKCRQQIYFETDDYIIRSAVNGNDLQKVLELRHEIFVQEWQGRRKPNGLDVDDFDFSADHLLIISKIEPLVVGTYRLRLSGSPGPFYSESEFHIESFLKLPGIKLELGRACIHADFRNGTSIDLLWKGLARYAEKTRARYLFGCSSVKTVDPDLVAGLLHGISAKGGFEDPHQIVPTDEYFHPDFSLIAGSTVSVGRELMPPLLRSYLLAGAKVHGVPAYDHEFSCFDLFTVLDLEKMNPKFKARYFSSEVAGFVDLRAVAGPMEAS